MNNADSSQHLISTVLLVLGVLSLNFFSSTLPNHPDLCLGCGLLFIITSIYVFIVNIELIENFRKNSTLKLSETSEKSIEYVITRVSIYKDITKWVLFVLVNTLAICLSFWLFMFFIGSQGILEQIKSSLDGFWNILIWYVIPGAVLLFIMFYSKRGMLGGNMNLEMEILPKNVLDIYPDDDDQEPLDLIIFNPNKKIVEITGLEIEFPENVDVLLFGRSVGNNLTLERYLEMVNRGKTPNSEGYREKLCINPEKRINIEMYPNNVTKDFSKCRTREYGNVSISLKTKDATITKILRVVVVNPKHHD
ncbi:hypothetical protein [Methanococcus maripaludis]|uniref:Uncharacterized protein n=1 Tax=Methanococcus maripaludis TaxID=39152 RepID=A0A7J9PCI8_METMI|nr:hypothetical protein [Methanococcus maripaludis]MBA2860965.1 hypothetical protein [Methanococcus maripaludis]